MADTGAPCTHCGDDVDYSAGDSGDDEAPVPVTCSHGGFVHARCMRDRAERLANGHDDPQPCVTPLRGMNVRADTVERLANGHVNPQPCVTCRSEWPVRSRPLHPAELAQGLLRSQSGERWPAVGSTLQFAELPQEGVPRLDPASYASL